MGKIGMEGGAGRGEATVTGCLGGQGHPHCTGETGLMPPSGLLVKASRESQGAPFFSMPLTLTSGQGGGRSTVPRGRLEAPGWAPLCPTLSRAERFAGLGSILPQTWHQLVPLPVILLRAGPIQAQLWWRQPLEEGFPGRIKAQD